MEENKEVIKNNKKGKPLVVGLIVLAIILIVAGVCLALTGGKKEEKKEEKEPKKEENVVVNIDTTRLTANDVSEFNGVYKAQNSTIKIYSLSNEKVLVQKSGDNSSFSYEFRDGYLYFDFFDDEYAIVLYKEGIGFAKEKQTVDSEGYYSTIDVNNVKFTAYKKTREYTKEDAFKDLYGDTKLLDSKYTGYYELESGDVKSTYPNGKVTMYIFETKEGDIDMEYQVYDSYVSEDNFSTALVGNDYGVVQADGSVKYENVVLTFNGDTLTVTSNGGEDSSALLSGTYKKVKNLTMDDVFKNIIAQ